MTLVDSLTTLVAEVAVVAEVAMAEEGAAMEEAEEEEESALIFRKETAPEVDLHQQCPFPLEPSLFSFQKVIVAGLVMTEQLRAVGAPTALPPAVMEGVVVAAAAAALCVSIFRKANAPVESLAGSLTLLEEAVMVLLLLLLPGACQFF